MKPLFIYTISVSYSEGVSCWQKEKIRKIWR